MQKPKIFEAETKDYLFRIEVLKDLSKNEFVAKLECGAAKHISMQDSEDPRYRGSLINHSSEEELRDSNEDNLIERCKERIISSASSVL